MAGVATEGPSRRRVLIGAAWAAPVILIATSAPARAASGDPEGIAFGNFIADYYPAGDFIADSAAIVMSEVELQKRTLEGPQILSYVITYNIPVGDQASPRWGFGSHAEGVDGAFGAQFAVATAAQVADGVFTISIRGTAPVDVDPVLQPALWVAVDNPPEGGNATATVVAIHVDDSISSSAASGGYGL